MSRKELFFCLLNETLSLEGFKYLKSKNSFVRRENGNEFIFSFEVWHDFYTVESHVKVVIGEIGEIEKIKKSAWGQHYDKFVTLGRGKSYLIDRPEEVVVLTNTETNVIKAAKGEIQFFHTLVKPYYQKALDYNFLDSKLNTKPGQELYMAYNPIHTSFLAIIVAKLTANERLLELFDFYREVMGKFNIEYMEEYNMFVDYLMKNKE